MVIDAWLEARLKGKVIGDNANCEFIGYIVSGALI